MRRAALLSVALVFASCGRVQNTLLVTNRSGVTADRITVTVCGTPRVFTDLKDGESRTGTFDVRGDSGFLVRASLSDGTTLTDGFGYVTGGAGARGNHARVEITRDRKIVGTQK